MPPSAAHMGMRLAEESADTKRRLVVQQTWCIVEKTMKDESTRVFYERLLQKNPELKPLFASVHMQTQAHKLYEVLQVAVRFLSNMDELVPVLEDMGVRHGVTYGVTRAHYKALNLAFIESMACSFESQKDTHDRGTTVWNEEAADAWTFVLNEIGMIMADAADRAAS